MKIVIATPLYPPEIGAPAPYAKELARRLSSAHSVCVVAYAHLPEEQAGVEVVSIEKGRSLIVRLFLFTRALLTSTKNADGIIAENGPSVELPVIVVSILTKTPIIFHSGDPVAKARADKNIILKLLLQWAKFSSNGLLEDIPVERPEILPFREFPKAEMNAYEQSWQEHIHTMEHTILACKK